MTGQPVLSGREIRVDVATDGRPIVHGVDLDLAPGEVLGLVGESGSGKTTTALALLGYAQPGVRLAGGTVELDGERLPFDDEAQMRRVRGRRISYVPQDPGAALNPALRVARQLEEMLLAHAPDRGSPQTIREALARVQLPSTDAFMRRFPHQLSGGQQQRLAIACALICQPSVAVLDEPTTGLDVVTQQRILEEIARLNREHGVAMLYVSHDLAVVATVAQRVAVMYAGHIVEVAPTDRLFASPRHPYTRGLIASVPDHRSHHRLEAIPGVAAAAHERPDACPFGPRCQLHVESCDAGVPALVEADAENHAVRCIRWSDTPALTRGVLLPQSARPETNEILTVRELVVVHRSGRELVQAVDDVSFGLARGECLALVGESGSGKSTLARCVVGLHEPDHGSILLGGEPLARLARQRTKEQRRRVQIVFQNAYDSLNARHTVRQAIERPARLFGRTSVTVAAALERVRLSPEVADRHPSELSGGQRQRVAIARALAAEPEVLVCDEITSALDVSVQAAILELLADLRRELALSMLFITHDLGVVAALADRAIVLERGQLREDDNVRAILDDPRDDYTKRLVTAAPTLPDIKRSTA